MRQRRFSKTYLARAAHQRVRLLTKPMNSVLYKTGRNIAVLTSVLATIGAVVVIAATLLNVGGDQHVTPWFLLTIFVVWAPITGVGLLIMARSRLRDQTETNPPSLRLVRTVAALSILYGAYIFFTGGLLALKRLLEMKMFSWFSMLSLGMSVLAVVAGLLLLVGYRRTHTIYLALVVLLALKVVTTTGPLLLNGMISSAIFPVVFALLPLGVFVYAYTVARAQIPTSEKLT